MSGEDSALTSNGCRVMRLRSACEGKPRRLGLLTGRHILDSGSLSYQCFLLILDAEIFMESTGVTSMNRGPCAKRQVECHIRSRGEDYVGRNDCANPQAVCPRLPGEGYEKCKSICDQAGHAEIEAIRAAGENARGGSAALTGHYWMCEPCGRALREAGVTAITIFLAE